ncbi:MAG TPA: RluA family pseudouridine synthase [Anaerolineales bacterium]|jgi:RluA family pseudouridine synthase|nr:RluA family pseudouridine synthase [Anaerolineales bacterium]
MRNVKFKPEDLVLWQDGDLLVIDKPAGLLVLPDGYDSQSPHLVSVLTPRYGSLWIVHRLDRHTSGIVIIARNPQAHQALNIQFEKRRVHKVYHALVAGSPHWDQQIVKLPLRADGDRRHRTVVDTRNGKNAVTVLRLLERYWHYCLVEAIPRTGRTHQIRVHLAATKAPIAADELYGDGQAVFLSQIKPDYRPSATKPERPLLSRLALHARALSFDHPVTGKTCEFQAPYPKDFSITLRYLRKYSQ